MKFKLVSAKGTKTVTGTEPDAIMAAVEMDMELQPAGGVKVENEEGKTIAEICDGKIEL